jgi:hypothetical protein
MLTIDFVGLIYFNVCHGDEKQVLLPDGSQGDFGIEPHFASLFVEPAALERDDWWPDARKVRTVRVVNNAGDDVVTDLIEFRIDHPRADVSFSLKAEPPVDITNLPAFLTSLQTLNPHFQPDLKHGETAAQAQITCGTLAVLAFQGSGVVQWTTGTQAGPFTITAASGRDRKTLTVKDGAEVVFANLPDLLGAPASDAHPHPHPPHALLYSKIDVDRSQKGLVDKAVPKGLDPLPVRHLYLRALDRGLEVPGPKCTPQCC